MDPKDRPHFWHRPEPGEASAAAENGEYPHQLPRIVHKANGEYKRVDTIEECEAAFADGYRLFPWTEEVAAAAPATTADGAPIAPELQALLAQQQTEIERLRTELEAKTAKPASKGKGKNKGEDAK
jgi:hypothetical protein